MSILDSMLKQIEETEKNRPKLTEEEKERIKLDKEKANKVNNQLSAYRVKVEGHFKKFLASKSAPNLRYPPMENKYRLIIHEVGEKCGCITRSFGREGIDRFVMAWRPNAPPSTLELQELQRKYDDEDMFDTDPMAGGEGKPDGDAAAGSEDYGEDKEQPVEDLYLKKRKFQLDEPDKLMVLGTTKRDLRTIEQIQQDLKSAKKQKTTHHSSEKLKQNAMFIKPSSAAIKKEFKTENKSEWADLTDEGFGDKEEAEKFIAELNSESAKIKNDPHVSEAAEKRSDFVIDDQNDADEHLEQDYS